MKKNIIHTGNCIDILNKKIAPDSIDMVFADPPYNLSGNGLKWRGNKTGGDWHMVNEDWDKMSQKDYINFTCDWIANCKVALKENGSIYIACSHHNIGEVIMALKSLNFMIKNIITWHKRNAMPNMTKRLFTHSSEFIVWAVKGKGWVFNYDVLKEINPDKQKDGQNKQMRDVWDIPLVQGKERLKDNSGKALHPTQKPEELLKRIILASTNEGDCVLDPFLGSGTTAYVAKQLKRKYIGIEQETKYVKIAKKRLGIKS